MAPLKKTNCSKEEKSRLDLDSDEEMTEERARRWAEYNRQVKESGGFDIDKDVYPGGNAMFQPLYYFKKDEELYNEMKEMAREALRNFKNDSGKQYELVDVEKVVWTSNLLHFITFKGKQLDAPSDAKDVVKTFQAIVADRFTYLVVKLCRIQPDKPNK